jgi:hypothetical protein
LAAIKSFAGNWIALAVFRDFCLDVAGFLRIPAIFGLPDTSLNRTIDDGK